MCETGCEEILPLWDSLATTSTRLRLDHTHSCMSVFDPARSAADLALAHHTCLLHFASSTRTTMRSQALRLLRDGMRNRFEGLKRFISSRNIVNTDARRFRQQVVEIGAGDDMRDAILIKWADGDIEVTIELLVRSLVCRGSANFRTR